jgi:hypothetical protein
LIYLLLTGHASPLWIACFTGSQSLVCQIFELSGHLSDHPALDGTTSFFMVLAKGDKEITKMFLESKLVLGEGDRELAQLLLQSMVEPKQDMDALYKAANTNKGLQTGEVNKE